MEDIYPEAAMQLQLESIRKDILALSTGMTLLYLGMGCREDVQRALNDSPALQLTVRGLFHVIRLIACALLPPLLVARLGTKPVLLIAYSIHALYLLINLDPRFSTLIPGAIATGITSASLWVTVGIYITRLAAGHVLCGGAVKNQAPDSALMRFLALFFCLFNVSYMVNSLISSFVLNPLHSGDISHDQITHCGNNYCNEKLQIIKKCEEIADTLTARNTRISRSVVSGATTTTEKANSTLLFTATAINPSSVSAASIISAYEGETLCSEDMFQKPPPENVYAVGGLFTGLAVIGFVVVASSVRPLQILSSSPSKPGQSTNSKRFCDYIGGTFEVLRNSPPMILISVIAFCYGLIDTFFIFDYPKAYILCIVGHYYVGFLTFCVGTLASLAAFALLWVHVNFCRLWTTLIATALSYICVLSLFVWKPHPDSKGVAFFLAMLWGVVKVIWKVQMFSLCGIVGYAKLSSAFSNLYFWWTLGQLLSFLWSEFICIQHKLYVLAILLTVAAVSSVAVELWLRPPIRLSRIAPMKSWNAAAGPLGNSTQQQPIHTVSRKVSSPQLPSEILDGSTTSEIMTPTPSAPLISEPQTPKTPPIDNSMALVPVTDNGHT